MCEWCPPPAASDDRADDIEQGWNPSRTQLLRVFPMPLQTEQESGEDNNLQLIFKPCTEGGSGQRVAVNATCVAAFIVTFASTMFQ